MNQYYSLGDIDFDSRLLDCDDERSRDRIKDFDREREIESRFCGLHLGRESRFSRRDLDEESRFSEFDLEREICFGDGDLDGEWRFFGRERDRDVVFEWLRRFDGDLERELRFLERDGDRDAVFERWFDADLEREYLAGDLALLRWLSGDLDLDLLRRSPRDLDRFMDFDRLKRGRRADRERERLCDERERE